MGADPEYGEQRSVLRLKGSKAGMTRRCDAGCLVR